MTNPCVDFVNPRWQEIVNKTGAHHFPLRAFLPSPGEFVFNCKVNTRIRHLPDISFSTAIFEFPDDFYTLMAES
jgi:hypothetical protein